jgi:hypothetical protein
MVFGVFSKIVMDFWFYLFRADLFLKKVGKTQKANTSMKSDAFEEKHSRDEELYVRHNSSLI